MKIFRGVNIIVKGEGVDDILGGGVETKVPSSLTFTHGSIDVNQRHRFNSAGLYDIHIMSNKLNRLRRSTLNNRHFKQSKQIPNVRTGH